ncbi:MAG: AMP-binding protein [Alkalilacustris sp.]
MNIALWLMRAARGAPGRPALLSGSRIVADYAAFDGRARALAAALGALGIAPGDRVALYAGNRPEYLVALFGIWAAGAVAVPINAKLHPGEAAWILSDSGARLTLAAPELCDALIALRPGPADDGAVWSLPGPEFGAATGGAPVVPMPRGADDLAWLFYTSGTTGRPKGVCITHGMLAATALCYPVDVDPVTAEDAALYAAPMSHGAGLYAPIHVRMGARHLVPPSGGFDAAEVLDLAAAHGPVSMFLAPTMVRRLLDTARAEGRDGAGIRTIVYGGGPMYLADILEAVDRFGPRFVQIYGQGECPMAITALSRAEVADRSHPRWRDRLGSVGRAQSLVEVAVDAPEGQPGEVLVRGAPVMPGYWNNPDATARTLQDGWLRTGDVGVLDEDGYLTLVDRSKDVIISGGTNIYPREVEEVLLDHPAIHEVSVIGRPSRDWGEEVVAFLVSPTPPSRAELEAHCNARMARFKRPKAWYTVASLPKNNYGKVLKTELRRLLAANEAGEEIA